ncbi:hypothetical protein C8Q76DRAFT_234969 [Earliella scabrosa]|nr:hypothetical protein C8Q76DRAFT_234969 [Earliella scabrosa]
MGVLCFARASPSSESDAGQLSVAARAQPFALARLDWTARLSRIGRRVVLHRADRWISGQSWSVGFHDLPTNTSRLRYGMTALPRCHIPPHGFALGPGPCLQSRSTTRSPSPHSQPRFPFPSARARALPHPGYPHYILTIPRTAVSCFSASPGTPFAFLTCRDSDAHLRLASQHVSTDVRRDGEKEDRAKAHPGPRRPTPSHRPTERNRRRTVGAQSFGDGTSERPSLSSWLLRYRPLVRSVGQPSRLRGLELSEPNLGRRWTGRTWSCAACCVRALPSSSPPRPRFFLFPSRVWVAPQRTREGTGGG